MNIDHIQTADTGYWRVYHDAETMARADSLRTTAHLISGGVTLQLDLYEQPDPSAPVFVFNHGGGGYSRLFIPLALALFDRGYTVILPDQSGQGLSAGARGTATIPELVNNITDAAQWARDRYTGPLYMGGGSVGGGLTYMAAVAGAPVDAIICHNLYDFGPGGDALALSHFAPLANLPGVKTISEAVIGLLARVLPDLRIPFEWLGDFRSMVDTSTAPGFYKQWKVDPVPVRSVTLRYLRSMFTSPPDVPFESNRLPVLVINPNRDRMTSPTVTRRNFERLGGPVQYAEIPFGHWALGERFVNEWVETVDTFLQGVRQTTESTLE